MYHFMSVLVIFSVKTNEPIDLYFVHHDVYWVCSICTYKMFSPLFVPIFVD